MHRCQVQRLKAVTLHTSKQKKRIWSRGRAINKTRAVHMQSSFRMVCSKIVESTLVHPESFNTCHQYKLTALLSVWNSMHQGLAARRAERLTPEWGNSCQLLAQSFAAEANNPTTYGGKRHFLQVGSFLAQRQHLLPPTELLFTHLITSSGKESKFGHTSWWGTLDLN